MIKLFQFPPCWGIPNASPFCMKVETYLRMTHIAYQHQTVMNPRSAPKGKLPYIEDKGRLIADSSLIIQYLKENYGDKLDAALTAQQRAQAVLLQRMMDEHLYWCILYSRWVDEKNWQHVKNDFFLKVPGLIRNFIASSVRKSMRKQLDAQGLGRHTESEIYQMGVEDLTALNTILSNQPFLLGDQPTSVDAGGYAFVANLIKTPVNSPLSDYAKFQKPLTDYCDNMHSLFYQ